MKVVIQVLLALIVLAAIVVFSLYRYFIHVPGKVFPELAGSFTQHQIESSGLQRSFSLYQPDKLSAEVPLLLVLHGSTGTGEQIRGSIVNEFDVYADRFGFLVAYPTGFENHWNDCRINASYSANQQNIDDVGFLRQLVSHIESELAIDISHVHAVGHSNGGHMAYRLGLEAPDLVSGITAVSASLPLGDNLGCTPSGRAVHVNIMNGTEDRINPYDGGVVELMGDASRGAVLSSLATAEYWAELASASGPEVRVIQGVDKNPDTSVELSRWAGERGVTVDLYTLKGSGHVIPAKQDLFPPIIGPSAGDVSAAAVIAAELTAY